VSCADKRFSEGKDRKLENGRNKKNVRSQGSILQIRRGQRSQVQFYQSDPFRKMDYFSPVGYIEAANARINSFA
jgi:hypothetical protein